MYLSEFRTFLAWISFKGLNSNFSNLVVHHHYFHQPQCYCFNAVSLGEIYPNRTQNGISVLSNSFVVSCSLILLLFRFLSTILTVVLYKVAEQLQVMIMTSAFWTSTNKCLLFLLVSWIALGVTLFLSEHLQTSWLMMWKTTQISSIEM